MKKILLLLALLLVIVTVNAQKQNKTFSNVQVAGDTSLFQIW